MAGLFDDLIPTETKGTSNPFSDLIPTATVEPKAAPDATIGPISRMAALRTTPLYRQIFGPSQIEQEHMIQPPVTPKTILDTAFKFASPPPVITTPIKKVTEPVIKLLPDELAGIAQGARDAGLEFPYGAAGLQMGERISKALLRFFEGDFALNLPQQYRDFQAELKAGNKKNAYAIATKNLLMAGLFGGGEALMSRAKERAAAAPRTPEESGLTFAQRQQLRGEAPSGTDKTYVQPGVELAPPAPKVAPVIPVVPEQKKQEVPEAGAVEAPKPPPTESGLAMTTALAEKGKEPSASETPAGPPTFAEKENAVRRVLLTLATTDDLAGEVGLTLDHYVENGTLTRQEASSIERRIKSGEIRSELSADELRYMLEQPEPAAPAAQPEGAPNAIPIRSPEEIHVAASPGNRPEVGGQVREGKEPALPQAPKEAPTPAGTARPPQPDVLLKPKSPSNKAVSETWKRLVETSRTDLDTLLGDWADARLSEDGQSIVQELGRERELKAKASKKAFLQWLASDEPFDPAKVVQSKEWVDTVNRVRQQAGIATKESAPPPAETPAVGGREYFHGTREAIEGALRVGLGKNAKRFLHEEGIWFAPNRGKDFETSTVSEATRYSGDFGTIVSAKLKIEHPYFGDIEEIVSNKINAKWLKEHGYDGFIDDKSGSGMVVVLDPSQIIETGRGPAVSRTGTIAPKFEGKTKWELADWHELMPGDQMSFMESFERRFGDLDYRPSGPEALHAAMSELYDLAKSRVKHPKYEQDLVNSLNRKDVDRISLRHAENPNEVLDASLERRSRARQMLTDASKLITSARLNYIMGMPREVVLAMKMSKKNMDIVQKYWRAIDAVEAAGATSLSPKYTGVPAERPAVTKEPWQMTKDEWHNEHSADPITDKIHRDSVEQALREGKPVPAEVLADYPELKAREMPTAPKHEVLRGGEEIKFTDSKTGNTIKAHISRVPGKEGTGAYVPVLDISTPTRVGGSMNHGNFTQSFEQAQAQLKQMLEQNGFSGIQAVKVTKAVLAYNNAWQPGFLEKQEGYDPKVASEQEEFVRKIQGMGEKLQKSLAEQRQPPNFGAGPPEYGQWITEENIRQLPDVIKNYGDFWVVLKWASSPREVIKASDLAKHYERIIKQKEGANQNEYLREIFVRENPFAGLKQKFDTGEQPPPLPIGPGAQNPREPRKAQIEQLTDAFRGIEGRRVPFSQKIKDAFALGDSFSRAKDSVSRALAGLKSSGDYLYNKWSTFKTVDEMLRAKGELSAELEKRGWRIREFVKQVKKSMPDIRQRAAIAKWVDAGGDPAELQRGLAETKPEYKRAYQEALNLKGDDLITAQNIRNFFDARLQEAIDAGVLEHGIEDYIHRIYEGNPKARDHALAYVQSGILSKNPSLAKKRVFQFDWEAEKLGYRPVQDFLPRIAQYESSLSKAIAARKFIQQATTMLAKDGRPVVGVKGLGYPVENKEGVREATLIRPSINPKAEVGTKEYRGDYVNREYPALSKWKWVATDTGGNPIIMQGDVAIHPDFVSRVDALLEPSKVRYGKYGWLARPAMAVGSTVKQTMLDLSFFHHVQIAVHAAEHRVMPWRVLKEIDFENPDVDGLLRGGVTLGGEYYAGNYGEGLVGRSLTQRIPGLGPALETYHSWLFQSFIPRIKMTMAMDALERNRKAYRKDLASGKMRPEDLYHLTANQANAAFGELNYTMLERNKTTQDLARLILLAPDFLEARGRFAGQALTRYGTEQRVALFLGALTMYTLARIGNKAMDNQYHFEPENAFSIVKNGRAYGLRTIQGDLLHLYEKPLQFWMSRLNPVYGRTVLELATGRDYFGRKRSITEQAADAMSTMIPISLRANRERKLWESVMNSFGVTARRWSDVDSIYKLAQTWKDQHGIVQRGEFIYDSNKDPLRPLKIALSFNDESGAVLEIKKLLDSGKVKSNQLTEYFSRYARAPFTGSRANDAKFRADLSDDEKKTYDAAVQHRQSINRLYMKAKGQYNAAMASGQGSDEEQTAQNPFADLIPGAK